MGVKRSRAQAGKTYRTASARGCLKTRPAMIRPADLGRHRDVSRVLRPNYALRFLLPPSLDEWAPADHPVRFVRDFVDALDLSELGIPEPVADEGRPPYGPDLLLKVWLFGYMERIRSTRALEKACRQVMPFLWLTGNLHPDHNTLWRFFNTHRKALPKLFKKLVKMAAEEQLIGFVLHALDGTKMTAASSTDEALHRKGLDEKLKQLDAFIASYMQEVSTRAEQDKGQDYAMPSAMADEETRRMRIRALLARRIEDREDEPKQEASAAEQLPLQNDAKVDKAAPAPAATAAAKLEPNASATDEMKPAATAAAKPEASASSKDETKPGSDEQAPQEGGAAMAAEPAQSSTEPPADPLLREAAALKKELTDKLAKLNEAGVNHLHEAEPEARMMKGRGTHALGYNAQIVVDHDSDMIVACEVVAQQNDLAQLVPMLEQVRETFGRVADQSLADGGYANGEQLKSCEENGTNVIVSLRQEPETKGEYSKAHFSYDAQCNVYVCPKGEKLVQVGTNKSHATTVHPDAIYRCRNKTCPVLAQCTKDALGRKIRRPHGEDARERQAEKQQDPRMRVLLSLRKEIVEHLFGIVKAVDGFRRFTVRGLEKARGQWSLVCMAVNLRKLSALATWKAGKLTPRLLIAETASASSATG
jgi:transposase